MRRGTRATGARARTAAWAAWLGIGLAAAPVGADTCKPWPGEPEPLPTLRDPDPLRAQWASLRAIELAEVAHRFEASDPTRARQLWRRLLCMDPANDEALEGVLRSASLRVHRPLLRDAPFDGAPGQDAWSSLGAPLGLQVERRPEHVENDMSELHAAVAAVQQEVRAARFEAALANTAALRARLSQTPQSETRTGLVVETEVLAATAQLALGRQSEAEDSLRRALAADPTLSLDAATTSPKVLRALEAARAGATR